MTFHLTDHLQEVPWANGEKSREPRFRLAYRKGSAELYVNAAARRILNIPVNVSGRVKVLVSTSQIAVALADEATGRTMRVDGAIRVKSLVDTLHLRDGDSFAIDVTERDGMLIGDMPGTLFTRRMMAERKAARAITVGRQEDAA